MARKQKITLVCPVCNNDFEACISEVERRGRTYCSARCQGIAKRIPRVSKDMLVDAYENQQLSTNELAELFGVSKGTIYNWMQHYQIPTRTVGEGVSIARTGMTHSEETKAKMSGSARAAWADPNDSRNSEEHRQKLSDGQVAYIKEHGLAKRQGGRRGVKIGKRADLGGMFFRSAWEANIARYLNWLIQQGQIASWEYEPDTFWFHEIKRGTRSYTPDFKVFEHDGSFEYHEVKGWMDQKSKTRHKRMKKYYPEVPIVMIDEPAYRAIKRSVSGLIEHWE